MTPFLGAFFGGSCFTLPVWPRLRYHSSVGWNTWFRIRRMRRFARELHITALTRVLDVGGTPETWDMLAVRPRVTLLNTRSEEHTSVLQSLRHLVCRLL